MEILTQSFLLFIEFSHWNYVDSLFEFQNAIVLCLKHVHRWYVYWMGTNRFTHRHHADSIGQMLEIARFIQSLSKRHCIKALSNDQNRLECISVTYAKFTWEANTIAKPLWRCRVIPSFSHISRLETIPQFIPFNSLFVFLFSFFCGQIFASACKNNGAVVNVVYLYCYQPTSGQWHKSNSQREWNIHYLLAWFFGNFYFSTWTQKQQNAISSAFVSVQQSESSKRVEEDRQWQRAYAVTRMNSVFCCFLCWIFIV